MKNNQLMIYGAYGYAGELMVREAVAQRLRPIIAGRDAEKLKPIATELSLECRAFGVRNTGSNLQDISVLLNCAGPFSATAEPLARACLAQQIHYLDITGEIDIFRKCHALDEEARQQNVLILPGAGTDIVPTDCLAAMLKEKLPVATRIDLALSFGTNPSIGTVNTMIESFGKGGLIREGGMLKVVSNAFQMRKIPFQNKPQWAMTIPWGDVFTSGISTGVPDGAVYMAMPRMSIYMIRLTNPVKGILNTQFGQKITKRLAGWLMKKGPDAKALEAGRGQFWGEAEAPDGEKLEMTMSTPNVYALTATVGIRIGSHHKIGINFFSQIDSHRKRFGIFRIRRYYCREVTVFDHLFGNSKYIFESPHLQSARNQHHTCTVNRSINDLHILMTGDSFRINRNCLHHIEVNLVNIFTDDLNQIRVPLELDISSGSDIIHFINDTSIVRSQYLRTVIPVCFVTVVFFRIVRSSQNDTALATEVTDCERHLRSRTHIIKQIYFDAIS